MLSDKWETLSDMASRTGFRGEDVIEIVREKFAAGEVITRFIESAGVKIMQIKRKEE